MKHEAEKTAQPFITNNRLGELIDEMRSTTKLTKWVLIFTILIFFLTILLLYREYAH